MKSILITSSILILLLAALRPLLRGRIDPRLQYALWLVIALRLLLPVELAPSTYSALALLDRAEGPVQVAQAIGQTTVPVPAMSYDEARAQVIQEYRQQGTAESALTPGDLAAIDAQARERSQGATLSQLFARYARPLWLGGAALAGLWFLLVNTRLRRRLGTAELALIEPSTKLPVFVSDVLPSPCLCGTLRPAIYVTPHAAQDPDRLRHVLAHEATHYRHHDHWWALARCLCLCLYWFDPLVWWAAALSRQDCELACDAGAIRRLGEEERLPYGRTLVDMIAAGRCSLMQTATTMTGGKRRVRERVRLIARRPKTVLAVVLALVLVLWAAVGCTFTGAPEESPEPSPDPSPLSSDALNTATLPARLLDVPEDLDNVEAASQDGSLAVYYFKKPGEELDLAQYLLYVEQLSQEQFDQIYDGSSSVSNGSYVFARGNGQYYALRRNTSIEYDLEDEEAFNAAYRAVSDFAQKTVLETEGVEPFSLDQLDRYQVPALIDRLLAAPSVTLSLAPAGTSRVYAYPIDPGQYSDAFYLNALASNFRWEEAPWSTMDGAATLRLEASDGSASLTLKEGSYLVTDGDGNCWKGVYDVEDYVATADTTPYEYVRKHVFDPAELFRLRTGTVPNRGQSHEEVVREWIEGWEGAMAKTAPGSQYACTYVRPGKITADAHADLTAEELEEFVSYRSENGLTAADYGKTWFTFAYSLVFVPVDPMEDNNPLWAGNTDYYQGNDAPEGALTWGRVGYMRLIDDNWVCEGVGTGW